MNFQDAIKMCFQKYATFSGRATRAEYWFFFLFCFLARFILSLLDHAFFGGATIDPATNHVTEAMTPLTMVFSLATFIPSIAVGSRRLHDVDKSGWWQLIALTIIGIIPLLIWYCTPGKAEPNRFSA